LARKTKILVSESNFQKVESDFRPAATLIINASPAEIYPELKQLAGELGLFCFICRMWISHPTG
jgi:hypothetical protein